MTANGALHEFAVRVQGDGYSPRCACGWTGDLVDTSLDASVAWDEHYMTAASRNSR